MSYEPRSFDRARRSIETDVTNRTAFRRAVRQFANELR
jgi:hypothetical protein